METVRRKKRFSLNQIVVFRNNTRNLVGKIYEIKSVGKATLYDVLCEDGKIYSELGVDQVANQCIDTKLTRLFYKKYDIDENSLPGADSHVHIPDNAIEPIMPDSEIDSEIHVPITDEILYELEDSDPNW